MTTTTTLDPEMLDRARGSFIGAVVGDALGAGYEFGVAPLRDRAEMIGGGLGNFAPGEYTDDSSMAVAIALVTATGVPLTDAKALGAVGENFLAWFRTNPPDVGNSTRAVLSQAATAADLADLAVAHQRDTGRGGGNGALMRTAPVALRHLDDPAALARAARATACLTHGDPDAGDSCVLWCAAIAKTIRTGVLAGPAEGLDLLRADRGARWFKVLAEVEDALAADDLRRFRPNGWTVTALQAAWGAIVSVPEGHPDPADAALQAAIAIGDDTDTVASIAGALIGASVGVAPFERYRDVLHGPLPGDPTTILRWDDLIDLVDRTLGVT